MNFCWNELLLSDGCFATASELKRDCASVCHLVQWKDVHCRELGFRSVGFITDLSLSISVSADVFLYRVSAAAAAALS